MYEWKNCQKYKAVSIETRVAKGYLESNSNRVSIEMEST